jgi:hypothetical protein
LVAIFTVVPAADEAGVEEAGLEELVSGLVVVGPVDVLDELLQAATVIASPASTLSRPVRY